jgi:hypothetical protein
MEVYIWFKKRASIPLAPCIFINKLEDFKEFFVIFEDPAICGSAMQRKVFADWVTFLKAPYYFESATGEKTFSWYRYF